MTCHRGASALLGALWLAAAFGQAGAGEWVELYDKAGGRSGYAIIHRDAGRADFYDLSARQTGFAQVDAARPAYRVNFFTPQGRMRGFAVVNRESRRVEFFDPASRHSAWGILESSGRVTRLDLSGRRLDDTAVPTPPRASN